MPVLAVLGPGQVVIQSPRPLPAGRGAIHVRIDRQRTVYHVELPAGINPERLVQPVVILSTTEKESAARPRDNSGLRSTCHNNGVLSPLPR
jgi:hypothetical protein